MTVCPRLEIVAVIYAASARGTHDGTVSSELLLQVVIMLLLYTVDAIKQCMALPRRSAGWGSRQQAYDLVSPAMSSARGNFFPCR